MKAWIPYNIDKNFNFWIAYLHETLVMLIMIHAYVALNGLTIGMMQQICGQLDIISHRLCQIDKLVKKNDQIPTNSQFIILKQCVHHHSYVYLIGKKLNNILGWLALFMSLITIIILCSMIYQVSTHKPNSLEFWSSIASSNSLLIEIFLYCWFGQEMIGKSTGIADAAYEIDWSNLSIKSKKYLILIILRAARPIQWSGFSIVTMSLETFFKVLKVSYSSFNLIKSM
ncbi:odorant receptor Or2-like isoform X2 [Leptopilina boulardi]|uniref:odorant receptor Or2-like isoform X2 n=2 Tax=Leptopilina boulardi TaxID=63433 RepID=UPI0021F6475B|nr:odorant receptor Or2-like isoform X2 [Leptopilina boulardi]